MLGLTGCAEPMPAPPEPTAPPPAANIAVTFEQAALNAADGVIAQAELLPAFAAQQPKHGLMIDPMRDAPSGQQTPATALLQQRIAARLAEKLGAAELLRFEPDSLPRAKYLLTGTLTRTLSDQPKGALLVNLALTDLKTGNVVAQAWALAHGEATGNATGDKASDSADDGLDNTPLPFYADSPVAIKDRVVDGYITTSATGAGKPADAHYLSRIAAATVIGDAISLYDAEQYAESLDRFREAGADAGSDPLRVLDGLYLASLKLGRLAEAEAAFGRLVADGIANRRLDLRFLFDAGGTAFSADPHVNLLDAMWLRQIARQAAAAKACLNVVGHTSRTGSEAANESLSLQRANFVRHRLAADAPVLKTRIRAIGRGSRDNIVGSGTDDAVDALDRRVEITAVPCR